MNITFVYSSLSGNTKRLAYALKELYQMPSSIMSVEEYEEIESDVYVLCSWIDRAKPDEKSMALVERFQNKKVYLLATLGASPDSEHGDACRKNMREIYKKSEILGIDLVQGGISDQVINMFKELPVDHPHALSEEKLQHYQVIKGRPNEDDIHTACKRMKKKLETVTL